MLQAAPQKIDLQRLAADFTLQFGHLAFVDPALPVAGKGLHTVFLDLTPPAVQHVRVNLAGLRHFGYRGPEAQPPNGFLLELPGELPSRSHDTILHSLKIVS